MLFHPIIIKQLLKYLVSATSLNKEKRILARSTSSILKEDSFCTKNTRIDVKATVNFNGVTMICVHPQYETPFVSAILSSSTLNYEKHIDHLELNACLGKLVLSDLTGHPNTRPPDCFLEYQQKDFPSIERNELACLEFSPNEKTLDIIVFEPYCQKAKNELENAKVFAKVLVDRAWFSYIHELSLKRVFDYLVFHISNALSFDDDEKKQNSKKKSENDPQVKFEVRL